MDNALHLLIDADNVSAKYIKADFNRAFKIWKYYVQKNLWRLDEYATFKLEG